VYLLVAWACGDVVTLAAFLAVSLDDLTDVGTAALRGSAPALWIVPALFLLAMPDGAAKAAALLLIALSVAMLASQCAPRRYRVAKPAPPPPVMFGGPGVQPGWMTLSLFPVVLGALAMQAGVWFLYVGSRPAAALAVALGAAMWARSWAVRGVPRERRKAWPHVAAFLLALVVAWPSWRDTHTAVPLTAPPRGVVRLSGVPGVIMRTSAKPAPRALPSIAPPPGAIALRLSEDGPLAFPFNGEYHLLGTAYDRPPEGSEVENGTPLDAAYLNTSGGAVITEAYQRLIPPLDFRHCSEVEVDLRNGETFGAAAAMQLIAGGSAEDLGTEFFGLARSSEETLQYVVPLRGRPPVTAIRLRFYSMRNGASTSAKVAVERFRLLARP
jgi:hypothetical protein